MAKLGCEDSCKLLDDGVAWSLAWKLGITSQVNLMKIVISGASGLVGTALTRELQDRGDTVARLVRPGHPKQPNNISWNPAEGQVDPGSIEDAGAVVHLSGASIAGGRWTEKRKAELRNSRVGTTKLLVDALASTKNRPKVFEIGRAH